MDDCKCQGGGWSGVWVVLVRGLQWLNGWIGWCYSRDLYTKQQCSTQRTAPPSRLIKSYIIERKLSLRFQENSNTFDRAIFAHWDWPTTTKLRAYSLIFSGLADHQSVHDWMTLSSPLHVTFPLPGGSSHFNLTLNWLFIHSVQVSKSLGITFQLETFKDQYSKSWMITLQNSKTFYF